MNGSQDEPVLDLNVFSLGGAGQCQPLPNRSLRVCYEVLGHTTLIAKSCPVMLPSSFHITTSSVSLLVDEGNTSAIAASPVPPAGPAELAVALQVLTSRGNSTAHTKKQPPALIPGSLGLTKVFGTTSK